MAGALLLSFSLQQQLLEAAHCLARSRPRPTVSVCMPVTAGYSSWVQARVSLTHTGRGEWEPTVCTKQPAGGVRCHHRCRPRAAAAASATATAAAAAAAFC